MVSSQPSVEPHSHPFRKVLLLLGLAALELVLLGSVWPRFCSPNECSRIFAAHAMVTRGTWSVDVEVARYGFVDDLARADGHLYSNKAPGLIWAAVPVVALVRLVHPGASLATELVAARLVLVSGAALAGALVLALWAGRGRERAVGPHGAVFVLLFASPFAVYAGTFFSHAWTGSLMLVAAWLLVGRPEDSFWTGVLGGALMGLAVVSEYPAALVAVPLGIAAGGLAVRRYAAMAAGAALPLGGLALYNLACFGGPLRLASRFEALPRYGELARDPTFGFTLPTMEGLVGLTVSPLAGLFLFAPVLLPALAVPVLAWRRGDRRLAVVLGAAAWLVPLVMSGYREWAGGTAFGPRYLVLTVPLLVVGLAMTGVGGRWRVWLAGAGLASAAVALLGRLTPPFAIDGPWWASTLRGWTLPALRDGLWNPPFGASSPVWILSALAVVAAVWVVAAWLGLGEGPDPAVGWPAALVLAVALLAVQFGSGRVVERQERWLERVAPVFRVTVGTGGEGRRPAPPVQ